jgi:hypothetical protein
LETILLIIILKADATCSFSKFKTHIMGIGGIKPLVASDEIFHTLFPFGSMWFLQVIS